MKYVTAPAAKAYFDNAVDDNIYMPSSCDVIEADNGPRHSGLFNADGDPLYRIPELVPLGYRVR